MQQEKKEKSDKKVYPAHVNAHFRWLKTPKGRMYSTLMKTVISQYKAQFNDAEMAILQKYYQLRTASKWRAATTILKQQDSLAGRKLLFSGFAMEKTILNLWQINFKCNIDNPAVKLNTHDKLLVLMFKKWFKECTNLEPTADNIDLYFSYSIKFPTIYDKLYYTTLGIGMLSVAATILYHIKKKTAEKKQ